MSLDDPDQGARLRILHLEVIPFKGPAPTSTPSELLPCMATGSPDLPVMNIVKSLKGMGSTMATQICLPSPRGAKVDDSGYESADTQHSPRLIRLKEEQHSAVKIPLPIATRLLTRIRKRRKMRRYL